MSDERSIAVQCCTDGAVQCTRGIGSRWKCNVGISQAIKAGQRGSSPATGSVRLLLSLALRGAGGQRVRPTRVAVWGASQLGSAQSKSTSKAPKASHSKQKQACRPLRNRGHTQCASLSDAADAAQRRLGAVLAGVRNILPFRVCTCMGRADCEEEEAGGRSVTSRRGATTRAAKAYSEARCGAVRCLRGGTAEQATRRG